MPKYDVQLDALEAVLDEDQQAMGAILQRLTPEELVALGTAAQQLAERCEAAYYRSLAAETSLTDRLVGGRKMWRGHE